MTGLEASSRARPPDRLLLPRSVTDSQKARNHEPLCGQRESRQITACEQVPHGTEEPTARSRNLRFSRARTAAGRRRSAGRLPPVGWHVVLASEKVIVAAGDCWPAEVGGLRSARVAARAAGLSHVRHLLCTALVPPGWLLVWARFLLALARRSARSSNGRESPRRHAGAYERHACQRD
jgi:hypothetical protein